MNSLDSFKKWKKEKLFQEYRDRPNFQKMVEQINRFNVSSCPWSSDQQKTRMIHEITQIQNIQNAPPSEVCQMELQIILRATQEINFIYDDNYEQFKNILMDKKGKVTKSDIEKQIHYHSNSQAYRNIERYLLSKQPYKSWAQKFATTPRTPPKTASQMAPNPLQSTSNSLKDKLDEQYQKQKLRMTPSKVLSRQEVVEKTKNLEQKANELQKKYGKDLILQIKLFKQEYKFLESNLHSIKVSELQNDFQQENKKINHSVDQYFKSLNTNAVTQIQNYQQMHKITKLLVTIDTSLIQQAFKNNFSNKLENALFVIGDTGVGKSTFLQHLLGYEFHQNKRGSQLFLETKKQLQPQHKSLIAKQSLQSVTTSLNAYDFSNGKTKISLVDSPGFCDTRGTDVEICNQLILESSFQKCQKICYLYLVELSTMKNRGALIAMLARILSRRFEFQTLEQLKSMLILVFNNKVDKGSRENENILINAKEILYKSRIYQLSYNLNQREQMALQFIIEQLSLKIIYDPLNNDSIRRIKDKIFSLSFKKPHKIHSNFDPKNYEKIVQYSKYLKASIQNYFQKKQYQKILYYYNELIILANRIPNYSKGYKEQVQNMLNKYFKGMLNDFFGQFKQNVKNLNISPQEFKKLMEKYTTLQKIKQLVTIDLNQILNGEMGIISQQILKLICPSSKEIVANIINFIGIVQESELRTFFTSMIQQIERLCSQRIGSLGKQIEHCLKDADYQDYDKKMEEYSVYQMFYQGFQKIFKNIFKNKFQKLEEIIQKGNLKKGQKMKIYQQNINILKNKFIKIEEITDANINELNNASIEVEKLRKSTKLQISQLLDKKQQSQRKQFDTICNNFYQQIEILFQFTPQFQKQIPKIKVIFQNIKLSQKIQVIFIKQIIQSLRNKLDSKVKIRSSEFISKIEELHQNTQSNVVVIQEMLSNIEDKLKVFAIFNQKDIQVKLKELKKQFQQALTYLSDKLLNINWKRIKNQTAKDIFRRAINLQKGYPHICQQFNGKVNKMINEFKAKIQSYLTELEPTLKIKQFKVEKDCFKINQKYIQNITHYINNILLPSKQNIFYQAFKATHQSIFTDSLNTFQLVDHTITKVSIGILKSLGNSGENSVKEEGLQGNKLVDTLAADDGKGAFNVLSHYYKILSSIDQDSILSRYIRNQSAMFQGQGLDPIETVKEIEKFIKQKYFQIKTFANRKISSTNSVKYIDLCKQCQRYQQLQKICPNKEVLLGKDESFDNIENKLIEEIKRYNGAHQSRIQKLIDIDNVKILSLNQCQQLYKQLKRNYQKGGIVSNYQQSIEIFADQLNKFLSRKIENNKIDEFQNQKLFVKSVLQNLKQFIVYSTTFHRCISKEDIKRFKFYQIATLDNFIKDIIKRIKKQFKEEVQEVEQIINHRDFKTANTRMNYIDQAIKMIEQFEKNESQENLEIISEQQSINHWKLKLKQLIKLDDTKKHNENEIIANPLSDEYFLELQNVITKLNPQKKLILRQNITNKMDDLLRKYQFCGEGQSKSTYNELRKKLHSIPPQIRQTQNYTARLTEIRSGKLSKAKQELKKLKLTNDKQSIIQLVTKYMEFQGSQNIDLKNECKELIQSYLTQVIKMIENLQKCQEIAEIAFQKFWSLNSKNILKQASVEITELLTKYENIFVNKMSNRIAPNINFVQNLFHKSQRSQFSHIKQRLQQIYAFYELFSIKKLQPIFPQRYNQTIKQINDWFQSIKDRLINYEFVNLKKSYINLNQFPKQLRKSLEKAYLFESILSTLPDTSKQDIVIDQFSCMEIQAQDSNHLMSKIKSFYEEINSEIERIKEYFFSFQFDNSQQMKSFKSNKQLASKSLSQLYNNSKILNCYEKQLKSKLQDYNFTEAEYNIEIRNIQQKLRNFIDNFKQKFNKSIAILEEQTPYEEVFYLKVLLEAINNGSVRSIFCPSNQQSSMVDEKSIINPQLYIKQIITEKICILRTHTDAACKILVFYFKITKPQEQIKIKALKKTLKDQEERSKLSYEDKVNSIRQANKGMEQGQLQNLFDQAYSLYQNQLQNAKTTFEQDKEKLQNKLKDKQQQYIKVFCQLLIIVKKIHFNINFEFAKTICAEIIGQKLKQINQNRLINVISDGLQRYSFNNYGFYIKDQSSYFRFESILEFNKKTIAQNVEYVLKNIRNDSPNKNSINRAKINTEVIELEKNYNEFINQYKEDQSEKTITKIIQKYNTKKDKCAKLAIILTIWSIKSSTFDPQEESQQLLIKAHPVQIITLLLLSQPNADNTIKSQLAQVLTGQGKSILLATLAIYFAKNGLKVNVVCYSAYLCQRDFQNFKQFFHLFEVVDLIKYNTINQACNNALTDKDGKHIKQIIEEKFKSLGFFANFFNKAKNVVAGALKALIGNKKQNEIILIDEVDTFFDKEYFGTLYRPLLKLNDEVCKQFILYVYQQLKLNSKVKVQDLKKSKPFQDLVNKYKGLQKILANQIYSMKSDFLNPHKQSYEIHLMSIKYKDKDKLSENLHFGYETIFANIEEFSNGKISKQNYQKALFIPLIMGDFSYSQLPKRYTAIIGLSGTIHTLPQYKKKRLKYYGIEPANIYYLPSIYGQQNQIKPQQFVVKDTNYYQTLIDRAQIAISSQRPVIIAFKDYKQLEKFTESQQFNLFRSKGISINFLHQKLDDQLRNRSIKSACCRGRLTLTTSEFSRGTDYIVGDRKVRQNGGLHIIMAYTPETQSEFSQFKGRTGRQGQKGSIDIVLNQSEQPWKQWQPHTQIMDQMYDYWENLSVKQDPLVTQRLQQALKKHTLTMQLVQKINNQMDKYIDFLFEMNSHPQIKQRPTKVIIGIDGTGSMGQVLQKLIKILNDIMYRIQAIKKQSNVSGELMIKIVVYRNYNSGNKILQASDYSSNAENLTQFLDKIKAEGGWENEAIEMLYRYINFENQQNQQKVDMMIIIGDAPPNTLEDVRRKRNCPEWKNALRNMDQNDFRKQESTVYHEEKQFSKDFVIHGLYINGNKFAKNSPSKHFKQVARGQGQVKQLNLKDKNCQQFLTKFFTTNILIAVGGNGKKEEFQKIYRQKFRSYAN